MGGVWRLLIRIEPGEAREEKKIERVIRRKKEID